MTARTLTTKLDRESAEAKARFATKVRIQAFRIASLAACFHLAVACTTVAPSPRLQESAMQDAVSLDDLDFLLGRWVGVGPDGKPFYEAYVRSDANTLRSERHEDATYSKVTDGSVVALKDGELTSTWGEFTWRADRIEPGFASFAPVNAPSAFTWRQIDADTVEVTQNWTDEAGKAQTYSLQLKRAK